MTTTSLLPNVYDQDKNGWTVLHHASARGELQEVKRLLAAGADVNASTTSNAIANGIAVYFFSRPLHIAASFGFVDVVQCLVENGADIEAQSFKSGTALQCALRIGQDSVVEFLLWKEAKFEKDNSGGSPMLDAAYHCPDSIGVLLLFGCALNPVVPFTGQTPLMECALNNRVESLRLLLSLNTDTTKTDNDGKTALQLAKNDKIKTLFLDHEKKSDEERKQLAKDTLAVIENKVSIRLMRWAQPEIIGICLAFAPLELPPYVLLWIIDELPNYEKVSHHKKIELITSVRDSIWKLKGRE